MLKKFFKNLNLLCLSILILGLHTEKASAQLINVSCTDPGALTQTQCDTAMAQLETELNSGLPDVETGQYTQGIANSNAMSSTGVGYALGSDFDWALLGGGLSLGVDLGQSSLSDVISGNSNLQTLAGLSAQGSVVLGLNPGQIIKKKIWLIEPSRMRIYLSFLSKSQSLDAIAAKFTNFGLMGSYKILGEKSYGLGLLKWNGVNLVSGLRYSKFSGTFTQQIDAVSINTGVATASADAAPAIISASSSNFSVPIEANTSVKLLHFLTFSGGLGADLNFGNTSGSGTYDTTIGISGGATGAATANVGSDSSPTLINLRGVFGVNLDLAVASLNFGVQKSLTAGVWGLNTGFHMFW